MQYTLLKQLKRNESYRLYAQDNLRTRGLVKSTKDKTCLMQITLSQSKQIFYYHLVRKGTNK